MKYIKKYETDTIKLPELKKYIVVFYNLDSKYYIDTIKEIGLDKISCNILYKYIEETQKLEKQEDDLMINISPISKYLKDILFTSNNLEECLNFINIYTKAKKYNI